MSWCRKSLWRCDTQTYKAGHIHRFNRNVFSADTFGTLAIHVRSPNYPSGWQACTSTIILICGSPAAYVCVFVCPCFRLVLVLLWFDAEKKRHFHSKWAYGLTYSSPPRTTFYFSGTQNSVAQDIYLRKYRNNNVYNNNHRHRHDFDTSTFGSSVHLGPWNEKNENIFAAAPQFALTNQHVWECHQPMHGFRTFSVVYDDYDDANYETNEEFSTSPNTFVCSSVH